MLIPPSGGSSGCLRPGITETPDQKIVWGPPPMANHGPGYLNLSSEERSEIRQLHHNLGHPGPQRFAQYLKQGGAGVEVQQGALDCQCDACSESRAGYLAARPSHIHENIAFHTKVGIDLVSWSRTEFHLIHFIDEGTLFHLGVECRQGADEVTVASEKTWINWAGCPQEVYVDHGSEFVSEKWALKMQETGTRVRMSAADSHWQLGRAEIHGNTVKRMLA